MFSEKVVIEHQSFHSLSRDPCCRLEPQQMQIPAGARCSG